MPKTRFIAALGHQIEQLVGGIDRIEAARVGRIGAKQRAVLRHIANIALRRGDPILMIEIADMAGVEARLRAAGFTIQKGPETSHIKSVSDEWDAKFMFVIDPDGHMLELTERLN